MRKGKKDISSLSKKELVDILEELQGACLDYAGDSYEAFGREVVQLLVQKKFVQYGHPLVLYHCTHKSNFESIYENGLKPGCPANWDGMSMENKIYFAFDPEVALDYAMNSSKAEEMGWNEEDFLILEYDYESLDSKSFSYDWNNKCEYGSEINSVAYDGAVSPGALISYGTFSQLYGTVSRMRRMGAATFTLEDFKGTTLYEKVMNTFEEEVETNKERED